MSTIKIKPTAEHVLLDLTFQSTQTFTYVVEVEDSAGNKIFYDTGSDNGKVRFDLGPGSALVDKYLNIYWVVVDLNGAGNPISGKATASQAGATCATVQTCTGTSVANSFKTISNADLIS